MILSNLLKLCMGMTLICTSMVYADFEAVITWDADPSNIRAHLRNSETGHMEQLALKFNPNGRYFSVAYRPNENGWRVELYNTLTHECVFHADVANREGSFGLGLRANTFQILMNQPTGFANATTTLNSLGIRLVVVNDRATAFLHVFSLP